MLRTCYPESICLNGSVRAVLFIFDRGNLEDFAEPVLFRKSSSRDSVESGYWILRAQYEKCYTDEGGFRLPEEHVDSFDFLY